ncbi:MAG: 5'-nucleotidase C-terminal domain-containing protein [Myxococcota bacterium]
MSTLTTTVAAAVVLPLVVQGEQLGELHDASCRANAREVRSALAGLRETGRSPTETEPVIIDTGNLLAPDPNTRYAIVQGGPGLLSLARALHPDESQTIFDLMVPGRFDLALRSDRLKLLTERAALPWTVANLSPSFDHQPWRIVTRDGLRVGLTAVIDDRMAPSLPTRMKEKDLQPARASLIQAVKAMIEKGADVVVAVVQQSSDAPLKSVLQLVDGAPVRPDVLIMSPVAGDVAQIGLGPDGPVILAAPTGKRRALVAHIEVRAGVGRPRFLGARRVRLDTSRDVHLGEVRREVCEALGRPIGPSQQNREITKAAFTQFVLQLLRRRTGAEVAVINRDAIRDTFPLRTHLTPLDLMRALPFDDGIQIADVRGDRMRSLLSLANDGRASVAGVSSRQIASRAIDTRRTYRVAAIDFVASGGDGIISPNSMPWESREELGELRSLVTEYLSRHGFDADADPDPDDDVREPTLLSAQVNLGGNIKTVTVANDGGYEAPQLSRNQFLGISALFDLRVIADMTRHRFQLFERTRFGIAREGTADAEENDDVTTVELTYIGRFASNEEPWYIPNASAAVSLETELTVPEEAESGRGYRRALLQTGVGPSFSLLPNISYRVQLGLRRELLASSNADDEAERLLAQIRMAVLQTLEVLQFSLPTDYGRPLTATLRIDHTFDLTGTVRDNILQGRLDFDIPIARRLSMTMGLELYFQDRSLSEGPNPRSGLAFDTNIGIKTFGDLSTVLY